MLRWETLHQAFSGKNVKLTGSPSPTLHYNTGFGGNCNIFDKVDFFRDMASRGYVVVCPDLVGYVVISSPLPSVDCNCNNLISSDLILL